MDVTKITPEGLMGSKKSCNIAVYVRVRPVNAQEKAKSSPLVIDTPGQREVVVREKALTNLTKTFTFDRVFGQASKQTDVYKTVVAPLVQEVLTGYNCTVFAYGQTGTGKTFTMEGERMKKNGGTDLDPMAGILPRALSQIFDEVRMLNCEFTVRVSFLELYNEELFDLLSPIEENKTKTLRLYEDSHRKGSVIIQGLEEVIVTNKQEVYAVLDRGSQQRKTAATLMNATSSRSHTVFTITVHLKESSVEGEEMLKVGKLHLVDLAGSENIGKSGAQAARAREAGSINQSLLTLGRVISALVERTPHVPYRESKLTRLLQDSLGGKTKTSIIATIGPAHSNLEETLNTLEYAHRAKNIMNKPEVNQKLTKKEALTIYTDEIERLRRDLMATREKNGVFVDYENYTRTMTQIDAQNVELNEKCNKIKALEEQLELLQAQKEEAEEQAAERIRELELDLQVKCNLLEKEKKSKAEVIEKAQKREQELISKLSTEEERAEELKYLVKYHLEHEQKLSSEASTILNTATDSMEVIEALHDRLDRKKEIENRNRASALRFRQDYDKNMSKIELDFHLAMEKVKNDFVGRLEQARGSVDEFWDETYVVDSPTGATPMPKKYELPAKLTKPSPHKQVIARYRSVRRDMQKALEACTKGPDDSWSESCFENMADPVTMRVLELAATGGQGEFGSIEDLGGEEKENEEVQRMETIEESAESKDVEVKSDEAGKLKLATPKGSDNEEEVEKKEPPKSQQQQKQQQVPSSASKGKRNRNKRKSGGGGGKGILKSSN